MNPTAFRTLDIITVDRDNEIPLEVPVGSLVLVSRREWSRVEYIIMCCVNGVWDCYAEDVRLTDEQLVTMEPILPWV